jgi:hypothetical protein
MTALANAAKLLDGMNGIDKLLTGASAHVRANAASSAFVLKITQGLIKLMEGKFFVDPIAAFKVWEQSPKDSDFELALEWIENVNSLKSAGTLALMSSSPIARGMLQLESKEGASGGLWRYRPFWACPRWLAKGPWLTKLWLLSAEWLPWSWHLSQRRSRSMASRFTPR